MHPGPRVLRNDCALKFRAGRGNAYRPNVPYVTAATMFPGRATNVTVGIMGSVTGTSKRESCNHGY